MTREVDSLINYHDLSGAPGVLTDINTPGVHSKLSAHYEMGTCSAPRALDKSNGCKGCAVDYAFVPQQIMTPGLMEIFNCFLRVETQLWELYHSGSSFWIKNGKRVPLSTVRTWKGGQTLIDQHRNHVHVAIRPGHFLGAPSAPIPTPQPVPQEDDMPRYAAEFRWPNGDQVQVFLDGHVECYGQTPNFGDMTRLRPDAKIGFIEARSVAPIDPSTSSKGYIVFDQRNKWFEFKPGVETLFAK